MKPVTIANYRGVLDGRVLSTFNDVPVKGITTPHVRAWVAALRDEGVGETTIALAFRLAGQVFELALEDGAIAASPMPRRNRPTAPKADEPMFITADQVDQLAASIDPHYRCWVYVMANTGLRWSEAAGLRVKRLDLMRAKLAVAEQLVDVNGRLLAQTPKTDSGRRTIDLPRWLVDMLTMQTAGKGPDDLVFTTETQSGPLRKSNFRQRIWSAAVTSAGLDGLRVHDLRHSHVAQLLAEGWDPVAISERLGHSDPKFTMSRYGHVRPDHRQALADRLEAYAPRPVAEASVANFP